MKSSAVYHGFAIHAQEPIEKLKEKLLRFLTPEKHYLLGISSLQRSIESLFFLHGISTKWIDHYYLLVLIQKPKEQSLTAIQDKIENNLQHFVSVTAIVLDMDQFKQWLMEGHPFAAAVYDKGYILYENEENNLPCPKQINEEQSKKENETLFIQSKLKVEGFLAAADLHRIRKEYKLSAFMLHQVTQQILRAMLIINTGLRINTHSIDRLISCCSMFCPQLADIFNRNNESEKKRFSLFNKAYIDTRYKDDYFITYEQLTALTERMKMIKLLFENTKLSFNHTAEPLSPVEDVDEAFIYALITLR
jgi:HEPN domain-containing protein